ncbi:MAG: hypothetical protein WB947_01080 [Thermoplasmata archaeon]
MKSALDRPPARLGPRFPIWAKLTLLWGGALVVVVLAESLLSHLAASGLVLWLVLPISATIIIFVLTYEQLRNPSGQFSLSNHLSASGYAIDGTVDERRPADPEELAARRDLGRGIITRREYERIIAYRHYVHGEMTHAQYDAQVASLSDREPTKRAVSRP